MKQVNICIGSIQAETKRGTMSFFAFADVTTVVWMKNNIAKNEIMSDQRSLDYHLIHKSKIFMLFCTKIGFQTTKKYPYEGVPCMVSPDWSYWQRDGVIRYTINNLGYHKSDEAIRDAIIENIKGPGYPCVGIVKSNLLREHPIDGHAGKHAVLIVGLDITSPDPKDMSAPTIRTTCFLYDHQLDVLYANLIYESHTRIARSSIFSMIASLIAYSLL
nr:hypothetical protein [Tanacetum cinerariifolium]